MDDEQRPAEWEGRITVDPAVSVGKPVIKGTRLSVEYILDLLAGGHSIDELLESWPHISREDVLACITYARDTVREIRVLDHKVRV